MIFSRADSILEELPDIIMELDIDNVYRWANKAGLEFFGDDVIGKDASSYCDDRADTCVDIMSLLNGDDSPSHMEGWQRRRDGEMRLLGWSCRPLRDDGGSITGAYVTARDITERTRIDEQIRQHNRMFENTIESLLHPFYVLDVNTYKIVMANKATAIYGDIRIGSTCYSLTHNRETPCGGSEHSCPIEEVRRTKKPVVLEHIHYDREGSPRHIEVHGYPIFDGKGEVVQMIEYGLDITERKKAEEELIRTNRRMKEDLEAAAVIQKSLLPPEYAEIEGVRIASAFQPCDELGGDIFNVFRLDDRNLGVYILDVSGHGVSASLLSVALSRILSTPPDRSSLLRQRVDGSSDYHLVHPVEVAEKLNRQFPMDPDKLQYFTMVYGILDMETYIFRYVVAGHQRPIFVSERSGAICIDKGGLPIGFLPDSKYEECSQQMKPGDRLFLYSDGIVETTSPGDEEFGQARLISSLARSRGLPLGDNIASMLYEVEKWQRGGKLTDDVSVLGIEIMK
jgi:PAS domain S-box-containing protein